MREIKFRAFINADDFTEMLYDVVPFAIDGDLIDANDDMYCHFSDVVAVMQYTGLKDKNGKEIYEGDVVEVHRKYENGKYIEKPYKTIVVWCDECAAFGLKNVRDDAIEFIQNIEYKVIGNIFENPELLEQGWNT